MHTDTLAAYTALACYGESPGTSTSAPDPIHIRFLLPVSLSRNLVSDAASLNLVVNVFPGNETAYVGFEGTANLETWLYNLSALVPASPLSNADSIHEGFANLAMEVTNTALANGCSFLDRILQSLRSHNVSSVVWTGHSAGGTLAGLVPWYLRKHYPRLFDEYNHRIVDFGTPRYVGASTNSGPDYGIPRTRYFSVRDLVPHTPPSLQWFHGGEPAHLPPARCPLPSPPLVQHDLSYFIGNCWHYGVGLLTRTLFSRILEAHAMQNYLRMVCQRNGDPFLW
jgi:hypothetical protein